MIRLRSLIEHGYRHPLLGPILVLFLVVLLSLIFLHLSEDGHHMVGDFGAACIAVAAAFGLVLVDRGCRGIRREIIAVMSDRGPPGLQPVVAFGAAAPSGHTSALPLRR